MSFVEILECEELKSCIILFTWENTDVLVMMKKERFLNLVEELWGGNGHNLSLHSVSFSFLVR